MGRWFPKEKADGMSQLIKELVREGRYVAEIDIRCEDDGSPWSPVVVKEDEFKTDRVRLALRRGDIAAAAKEAKVYELTLLAGE